MSEEPTLREHLTRIARSGGASRSERKREAAKRNLKRAWEARRLKRHGLLPPASDLAQDAHPGYGTDSGAS